jgi:predicted RNase H-like HicB family nuclease
MNRTYLIVFEKVADDNWSAFAPDVPGTGGMGDSVEEARSSLREGIGYMLDDMASRGIAAPDPTFKTVDFSDFDPDPGRSHYEVEWLTVNLPEVASHTHQDAQQAA